MTKAKPTPYFTDKRKTKIRLSGGDQVQIMLKSWFGSWSKYIKHEKRYLRQYPHKQAEIDQARRIQAFERQNKIRFTYKETQDTRMSWRCLN